jgi:AraC-like DNA-binding protein
MLRKDRNELHIYRGVPSSGSGVWLHSAGFLTGFGSSRYSWTPNHLGPHVIIRGRGEFTWPSSSQQVGPGDVFCLFPSMRVDYKEDPHDPWQYLWLNIQGEEWRSFAQMCGFSLQKPLFRCDDVSELVQQMQKMRKLLSSKSPVHPYRFTSELYRFGEICAHLSRVPLKPNTRSGLLDRAKNIVDGLFHTGINVNNLADALQISRVTLFHTFRGETGLSPIQYISERRLERAKQLLLEDQRLIFEVALSTGFRDDKYFIRFFRKQTGLTPSEWRRQWNRK